MGVQFFGLKTETEGAVDHDSVDTSNSNASFILDALGLDPAELASELPAGDFLQRVMEAEAATLVDETTPGYVLSAYLSDRLAELRVLAEACKDQGAQVNWA